ncbi:hypothetical protein LMG32289_03979 [Cupriavidus pampae]|uniref:DUF2788 domain-containing protein n=2 Tax=Cupriavidus pampae TaxID=659251 RepID=A0ABM8XDB5_9BURK|nr:hypothetical protein LMG32289_03979 [Cupriavidus pampae]
MSPATAGAFVKASRLAEFGTAISLAVFFVAFVVSLELKGKFARFYLRVGGLLMVVESFVLWIPVMRMAAAHG